MRLIIRLAFTTLIWVGLFLVWVGTAYLSQNIVVAIIVLLGEIQLGMFCTVQILTRHRGEPLAQTILRLQAVEGRWKDRPDPVGELEHIRHGDD